MIYRSTIEQVKQYYLTNAVNQTILKELLKNGVQSMKDKYFELLGQEETYEEKKHFVIGSGFDCRLSHGTEIFDSLYHRSKLVRKPGPKTMCTIKRAFDLVLEQFSVNSIDEMKSYREEVWKAANEEEFRMNIKKEDPEEDMRIHWLLKDNGEQYWQDLISAQGKQVLADDEAFIIDAMVYSVLNHRNTKHLFEDDSNTDIIFQFPMYWNDEDIACKAMPDMIIIYHSSKRIVIIDFKSTGNYITEFCDSIRIHRYDLQASYYKNATVQSLKKLCELIGKDISNYSMANTAFLAESTKKPGCPIIFPLTDGVMDIGRRGDGKYMLGWEQAMSKYKLWNKYQFSLEERVKETSGILFVDEHFDYHVEI